MGPAIGILTAADAAEVEPVLLRALGEAGFIADREPRSFRDRAGLAFGYVIEPAGTGFEPGELARFEDAAGFTIAAGLAVMAHVRDKRCSPAAVYRRAQVA